MTVVGQPVAFSQQQVLLFADMSTKADTKTNCIVLFHNAVSVGIKSILSSTHALWLLMSACLLVVILVCLHAQSHGNDKCCLSL